MTLRQRIAWWLVLGALAAGASFAAHASTAHAQTREDVITLINVAADRHSVNPDAIGRVLWCESRWNASALGWEGSQGIAQFQQITWGWASLDAGWQGYTPYDPEAAIDVMAWLLARGEWSHWKACW